MKPRISGVCLRVFLEQVGRYYWSGSSSGNEMFRETLPILTDDSWASLSHGLWPPCVCFLHRLDCWYSHLCVKIFRAFVLLWEGVTFSQGDRSSAHILRQAMFMFTMVWSVFSAPSKAEKCPRQTFLSSVFADTWRHFSACALRVGEPWFLIRHAQAPKNNPIPDAGFLPLGRRHLCKMCSSWQKAHHTPQGYLQSCPCHQGVWTAMGDDF